MAIIKTSDWKRCLEDLLDGVAREIRTTARTETKIALRRFRARLDKITVAREREQFERELGNFLQSEPCLRDAGTRYIRKKLPPIVEAAVATLKRAQRVLVQQKTRKLS